MKKNIDCFTTFLILFLLLAGCSTQSSTSNSTADTINKPSKEGAYVIKVNNEGLMVVNAKSSDYSSNSGEQEFYDAIDYNYPNASSKVKIGQRVLIESDGPIMESYPSRGTAKSIKILPEYQPDKADLSESQVVRKVLEITNSKSTRVPAIRQINYDKEKDAWTISVKQGEDKYDLEINDK